MSATKELSPPPNGPIFISHASADDAFVKQLREALESHHHPVWVDSRNLRGGSVLNREIEQAIESARHVIVVLSRDTTVGVDDLPPALGSVQEDRREIRVPIGTSMDRVEKILIEETLRHTGGNKEKAARLLGVATRTIYRKIGTNKAS